MLDRLEGDARPELDLARGLHDDLDRPGFADDRRVVGDRVAPGGDRALELGGARHAHDVVGARVAVRLLGRLDRSVRDGHDVHPGRGVEDLQHETARGEARADDGDLHRVALGGAPLERGVDEDHARISSSKSGQDASFSETIASLIGQSMPKAGSSQRMPSSAPGTYACETW